MHWKTQHCQLLIPILTFVSNLIKNLLRPPLNTTPNGSADFYDTKSVKENTILDRYSITTYTEMKQPENENIYSEVEIRQLNFSRACKVLKSIHEQS